MRTLAAALLGVIAACGPLAAQPGLLPVPMPGGGAGIGFDDLGYAAALGKVLVPGGRTGRIFLVDPKTGKITALGGFSSEKDYQGGHGEGVTSADEGRGLIFGSDRNAVAVHAVDAKTGEVVVTAKLGGGPDYVRYVSPTDEVWVSEPNKERIEIFSLTTADKAPALTAAGTIFVPGGPESLIIDATRSRAYTHTWGGETLALDLKQRRIVARWKNGCSGSRGIALDEKRGWLFAGCDEGKAVVLDAGRGGAILSSVSAGAGVDVIAYNPALRHLYLPGADSATMAVLAVSDAGRLSLVRSVKTAQGAHCVAADASGGAWVCDPNHGRLLFLEDSEKSAR